MKSKILLSAVLFTLLFYACKKENEIEQSNQQFLTVPPWALEQGVNTPVAVGGPVDTLINGVSCKILKMHWGPRYDQWLLNNPGGEITIGTPLNSELIGEGIYEQVNGGIRAPITFTHSGTNRSVTVDNPTLSNTLQAYQSLLDSVPNGSAPAQVFYEIKQVYSLKQVEVIAKVHGGSFFGDYFAGVDFESTQFTSRIAVVFYQVYFSLIMDQQNSDFWITPPAFQGNYTPAYVSSVKYGRIVLCVFESTSSASELETALRASFDFFVGSGGTSVSTAHESIFNASKKSIFIYGGSPGTAANVNSLATLRDHIEQGGKYSPESPGAPIAYTLRFLSNNQVARIVLPSDYSVRTCEVAGPLSATFTPSDINELRVYRINGDQELGGNPLTTVKVYYEKRNSSSELFQILKVTMEETNADKSKAERIYERKVWTAPSGTAIVSFSNAASSGHTSDTYSNRDIGPGMDNYTFPESNVMKYIRYNAWTHGDDITSGNYPSSQDEDWAHVHLLQFNKIKITYQ